MHTRPKREYTQGRNLRVEQVLVMLRLILPIVLLLTGCAGNMRHEYGAKHPEGELLATSCVGVTSFAPELRSAPGLHGPDSFVGYFDYGAGMPRGHVFLVAPVEMDSFVSIGELLQSVDPRRRTFWLETRLMDGTLNPNESFEAVVPRKERRLSPHSIIVDREAILVRASLRPACGKHYLVAVQGNPFGPDTSAEWPKIRNSFELLQANLHWPPW